MEIVAPYMIEKNNGRKIAIIRMKNRCFLSYDNISKILQ
jgi:hypothetical protein